MYRMQIMLELSLEKRKRRIRDESAIHAYSTVMWKISALYSSI
jgi:hypothetical protein